MLNIKRTLLFLIFFPMLSASVFASGSMESGLPEYKMKYGKGKRIPEAIELPALIALSFYPELANTNIQFEYKTIKTTMSARPKWNCLVNNKRNYIIYINNDTERTGGVSVNELSLNAQVGILAHELAHIADYESRSDLSLMRVGIYYKIFKHYHRKMERATDEIAIRHGLGEQLYDFSDYVLNHSNASPQYKEFKKKFYLTPDEIKARKE